jgi:hypothetical protein
MPRRGDVTARCDSLQAAASIPVFPVRCERWDEVGFCRGSLLMLCACAPVYFYLFIFIITNTMSHCSQSTLAAAHGNMVYFKTYKIC